MRNIIRLTFFIILGLTITNCNPCGCPPNEGSFFNIQGIEKVEHKEQVSENAISTILDDVEVRFEDYRGLSLTYSLSYLSQSYDKKVNGKAVLSACSCSYSGDAGSKNERIERLTVITMNDFNPSFEANDTINSLFSISEIPLEEYIAQNNELIYHPYLKLKLHEAPSSDRRFKVKVILELSTGETYEGETSTVVFEN